MRPYRENSFVTGILLVSVIRIYQNKYTFYLLPHVLIIIFLPKIIRVSITHFKMEFNIIRHHIYLIVYTLLTTFSK